MCIRTGSQLHSIITSLTFYEWDKLKVKLRKGLKGHKERRRKHKSSLKMCGSGLVCIQIVLLCGVLAA